MAKIEGLSNTILLVTENGPILAGLPQTIARISDVKKVICAEWTPEEWLPHILLGVNAAVIHPINLGLERESIEAGLNCGIRMVLLRSTAGGHLENEVMDDFERRGVPTILKHGSNMEELWFRILKTLADDKNKWLGI